MEGFEITNLKREGCGGEETLIGQCMSLPMKLCFSCRRDLEIFLNKQIDFKVWQGTAVILNMPIQGYDDMTSHQEAHRLRADAFSYCQSHIRVWLNKTRSRRKMETFANPVKVKVDHETT